MLLYRVNPRVATLLRLIGLGLVVWSVSAARHHPASGGRGAVVAVLLAIAVIAWLGWVIRPRGGRTASLLDAYVLAAAGGLLIGAAPDSASSVFVFVAVVSAGVRAPLARAATVVAVGVLAVAVSIAIYHGAEVGLLAYTAGFVAGMFAASNGRQAVERAEQAELLLAQTQRSHEEEVRAARLAESARIAREIHDVLAHTLAGLAIHLEATGALLEQGADRTDVLGRIRRAHDLAREGLQEARRAVGALRGGAPVSARDAIEALIDAYRASERGTATLTIDGDPARLSGEAGQTVLRVTQEALTNTRKHAPGSDVSVELHAGELPGDDLVLVIDDRPGADAPRAAAKPLAGVGGGYGLEGMRERAQLLGGMLSAGADGQGWRVELRLPAPEPS
jgi:signal transduction histidine kinase